jgi:hypothetical protein
LVDISNTPWDYEGEAKRKLSRPGGESRVESAAGEDCT